MEKLPISVVINTFQAESYLDLVLQAVADHVSEIVVCDMHSTDRTQEIAQSFGAKIVLHEQLGYADPARKFAVENSTQPWVFILDADEIVPSTLWPVIAELISKNQTDIISFHWLNYMFGAPIDGAGFDPRRDIHPRLFRRDAVTLHPEVHAYLKPKPESRVHQVPYSPQTCIHHFTYLSAQNFVARANKYTDLEAQNQFRNQKVTPTRALRKLVRDFLKRMIKQRGSKLGWQGFSISLLMLANDAMKFAKILEHQNNATPESIQEQHRNFIKSLLS